MGTHPTGKPGEPNTRTWKQTWRALIARPRLVHLVLCLICLTLGFTLVTQLRAQQTDPLESLSQQDLVSLLDQLNTREETLRSTQQDLEEQLQALKTSVSDQQAAADAAQKTREQAEINAGTVPVEGPGLRAVISDENHSVEATQFVVMLGELRNAGAEAIELNGIRLTSHSWFQDSHGGIEVDGVSITTPYTWNVIGAADTIQTALEIQGGSAQQIRGLGATLNVTPLSQVRISSTVEAEPPTYAKVHE